MKPTDSLNTRDVDFAMAAWIWAVIFILVLLNVVIWSIIGLVHGVRYFV